jgi:hypothetical protein
MAEAHGCTHLRKKDHVRSFSRFHTQILEIFGSFVQPVLAEEGEAADEPRVAQHLYGKNDSFVVPTISMQGAQRYFKGYYGKQTTVRFVLTVVSLFGKRIFHELPPKLR